MPKFQADIETREYTSKEKIKIYKRNGSKIQKLNQISNIKEIGLENNIQKIKKKKEYDREYYIQNKEKKKEYKKQLYLLKKEKTTMKSQEHDIRNKDKKKKYDREYYIQNMNKVKESHREYYLQNQNKMKELNRKYYLQNKDKLKESNIEYRFLNKEKKKEYDRKYRILNKEKIKQFQLLNNIVPLNSPSYSWKSDESIRDYFERIAPLLHIGDLSDWYRISRPQIIEMKGMEIYIIISIMIIYCHFLLVILIYFYPISLFIKVFIIIFLTT